MDDEHPEATNSSSDDAKTGKDSRLASFLRQGTAIIAAEKGLTPSCQAKLDALAREIRLPRDMLDQAMEQLRAGKGSFEPLTRYESAFLDFLAAEFEKLNGDVLSPRQEKRAMDIAASQYQLSGPRTEQLIELQCETDGISRVAPNEAFEFGRQAIEQRLGSCTLLDDQLQDNLYKIGRTWGLGELEVDQIAVAKIESNRKTQSEKPASRTIPLALLLLVSVSLLSVGWYQYNRGGTTGMQSSPDVAQTEEGSTSQNNGNPAPSGRLSTATDQALKRYIQRHPALPRQLPDVEQLASLDESRLLLTLPALSEHLLISPIEEDDFQKFALPVMKGLLLDLKNDAAIEALLAPWSAPLNQSRPTNVANWKSAYRAAHLFQWWQSRANSDRATIPAFLQASPARNLDAMESAIAIDQWKQLLGLAWSDPRQATPLVEPLCDLTRDRIPESRFEQLRGEVLLAIIDQAPDRFDRLAESCAKAIRSADDASLVRWASVILQHNGTSTMPQAVDWLIESAQLSVDSDAAADQRSALRRFKLDYHYQQLTPLIQRIELADRLTDPLLSDDAKAVGLAKLPEDLADTAMACNVELALILRLQAEDGWMDSDFVNFDRQQQLAVRELKTLAPLPFDSAATESGSQATASDVRKLNDAIDALRQPDSQVSINRKLSLLDQLYRVAKRFSDIDYADAAKLAEFLLTPDSIETNLELQKRISGFSHWNTLAIALADQVEAGQGDLDQSLTVTRILLGREFNIRTGSDWRRELSLQLLAASFENLNDRLMRQPDNEEAQWLRLSILIKDVFRWRLQLIDQNRVADPNAKVTLLARDFHRLLTRQLAPTLRSRPLPQLDQLAINDLDELSLLNQSSTQLLASSEMLESGADAFPTFQRRLASCETVGERLLISERQLLRVLHAIRVQQFESILNRL